MPKDRSDTSSKRLFSWKHNILLDADGIFTMMTGHSVTVKCILECLNAGGRLSYCDLCKINWLHASLEILSLVFLLLHVAKSKGPKI